MKKKILFIVVFILAYSYSIALANQSQVLFWKKGCFHCEKVISYLKDNNLINNFILKEVHQPGALVSFQEAIKECKIPLETAGVPLLVLKDKCLVGNDDIIDYLEGKNAYFYKKIIKNREIDKSSSTKKEFPGHLVNKNKRNLKFNNLTWPMVVMAALADSINPCAFAVLIILLSVVLVSNKKKKILPTAFSFIFAIFLAYLIMGLGGWKIFVISGLTSYFIKGAGILAIFLGVLNLKDFFKYGGFGFVIEVPFSWRPKLKKTIGFLGGESAPCDVCKNKCIKEPVSNLAFGGSFEWFKALREFSLPLASFLVGLFISLFLLPCTSGPYIVILGLLSKSKIFSKAFTYLFIYNLIFILPMVIISLLIFFGLNPKKLEKLREKNIKIVHLIIALLLLAIGFYTLFIY